MTIQFTKMHGLGNDFVVIDATKTPFTLSNPQIRRLADRHLGIGCDQLLVIEPSPTQSADFGYRIFNADGREVEQCGNGARCVARYLADHGLTSKHELTLATASHTLTVHLFDDGLVRVNMGVPTLNPADIPFQADQQATQYRISVDHQQLNIGAISLGNPHAIVQIDDINAAPLTELGPLIGQHPRFPQGVNVSFMHIYSPTDIHLRVYERGAGETLACGSAACAAVVYGRLRKQLDEQVTVHLPGGSLQVVWDGGPVWMTGPAETVFSGEWPSA